MATEGPTIHDGAQCVAVANYSKTGANLYGIASSGLPGQGTGGSGQFLFVALSAATARNVIVASVAGQIVYGVLQNAPALGQAADVCIFGITKVVTGSGGVTLGVGVTTDANGCAVKWTTGAATRVCGYALETVAANAVATIFFQGVAGAIT